MDKEKLILSLQLLGWLFATLGLGGENLYFLILGIGALLCANVGNIMSKPDDEDEAKTNQSADTSRSLLLFLVTWIISFAGACLESGFLLVVGMIGSLVWCIYDYAIDRREEDKKNRGN